MTKLKLAIFILLILVLVIGIFTFTRSKKALQNPLADLAPKQIAPSSTAITYEDPNGFKFDYPDNISLSKAEIEDTTVYTDLSLYSKDINGSISLNISDTKHKKIDDWILENKLISTEPSKEVMLGNMKATEIKTSDHLYLAAIDQGILFTISMPNLEEKFWTPVYTKVVSSFSFVTPQSTSTANSAPAEDAFFEGEEVVE